MASEMAHDFANALPDLVDSHSGGAIVAQVIQSAMDAAVKVERERCAKIAETFDDGFYCVDIANEIREVPDAK